MTWGIFFDEISVSLDCCITGLCHSINRNYVFKENQYSRVYHSFCCTRFWPGLGLPRPKAIVVIPKIQPLPKHLRLKRVKVRGTPATTLQKRPVKITMYLGLDIIIQIKFTTSFDRCAILNVLNYLTKNFES